MESKKLPKLDYEEQELIADFLNSDSYQVFMKLAAHCHSLQEEAVLNYNLSQGSDGLVITKARSEGSQRLLQKIGELKGLLTKKA